MPLHHLQLRRVASYRFRLLLVTLAGVLGAEALAGGRSGVLGPAGLLLVAGTLFAVSGRRWVLATALGLALPALGGVRDPASGGWDMGGLAGSGFHSPLFCFTALVVMAEVLRARRADRDTVVGSLCAYLLAALAFASLFAALETWQPGSFRFADAAPSGRLFRELAYFSLVTITTLGYGDVTPVSDAAIALVTLEATFGILYPAIVVARIVALYTGGGGTPFALENVGRRRRTGRFELLIAVELIAMLGSPFADGHGGSLALHLIALSLLLGALYAGSDSRWARGLGVALAATALAGELVSPDGGLAWLVPLGRACELVFLLLVSGSLLRWLAGASRVTRDMLLASIALYLLLGFAWSSAFQLVEALRPGSIQGPAGMELDATMVRYYSFMTLTTTGFGDFTPVTPVARRLASLESLVGIFYPAVLVARLVALYEAR